MNYAQAFFRFLFDSKTSIAVKLMLVATVAYVVMPADLIPDLIPILGWLDDVGVMGIATAFLIRSLKPYMAAMEATRREQLALREGVVDTTGVDAS